MRTAFELFEHELGLLYDCEQKVVRSLGRKAAKCTDSELVAALTDHGEASERLRARLGEVFALIDRKPRATPNAAINGLIEEFSDFLQTRPAPGLLDLFAGESARRVERNRICAYQALTTLAVALRMDEAAELLSDSLGELTAAADRLKALCITLAEGLIDPAGPEDS